MKNHLLKQEQDAHFFHNMVFVDSLDEVYTEESEYGHDTPSNPSSPFKGKTWEECAVLLQQLRQNGSDVNFESFVIMDARTVADDTVLVVGEGGSVRAACEIANTIPLVYLSGKSSMEEDQERAIRSPDGVLRADSMGEPVILARDKGMFRQT